MQRHVTLARRLKGNAIETPLLSPRSNPRQIMVSKAFLLDPAKDALPSDRQLPKFLRLVAARGGWDIVRPQIV
jgi:hypothetical protein